MMGKRKITFAVVLTLITMLLVSVAPAAEKKPIRIGAVYDLTGGLAV